MAPKNKGKAAPTKRKKGTNSTVATNAQARAKNLNKDNRKRQASDSDESSDGSSESSSDAPVHPKRKPRKRKKAEVHEDIPPDTVPEQVNGEAYQSLVEDDANDKVSCYIYTLKLSCSVDLPVMQGDDENDDDRDDSVPQEFNVKKDSTKDLLTIFSDLVTVKFKRNGDLDMETVRGRWCLLCKYVTQNGL
jgi:hypothetical protein